MARRTQWMPIVGDAWLFLGGIILPRLALRGGTIPHGISPKRLSILLAKRENRHAGRIERGAGNLLHHDHLSQTEKLGLSQQLFPSREILHAGRQTQL